MRNLLLLSSSGEFGVSKSCFSTYHSRLGQVSLRSMKDEPSETADTTIFTGWFPPVTKPTALDH